MGEESDPNQQDALSAARRIVRDASAQSQPPRRAPARLRLWHVVVINLIVLALLIYALRLHQQ